MYSWTPIGATSANISGLLAGTYSLTVTDFLGCTASGNVTITQPAVLVNTITSTNATCNNANNGTATVVASGGSPNYTYLWMPGSLTSGSVSGLAVGTYTLTTTDNHGCTKVDFVSITQPPVLTASFINHGNVSCFGGSNGSVTVNAAGGTPNYTYQWLPGNAAAATINNLQANTYTVTVTDVNGCSVQNSVTSQLLHYLLRYLPLLFYVQAVPQVMILHLHRAAQRLMLTHGCLETFIHKMI